MMEQRPLRPICLTGTYGPHPYRLPLHFRQQSDLEYLINL
jgi:hypothetical protein